MEESRVEELIERLSKKLGGNSRNSIQSDIEFLFRYPEHWKVRSIPGLSAKRFDSLRDFITYRSPWGLGWTMRVAEAFILPELPEIWKAIESETPVANPPHIKKGDDIIYNVKDGQQGTSRDYSISVLKRDNPEIAEMVVAGEITAAEGMRRAGKRSRKVTIEPTVSGFCKAIMKHLNDQDRLELIDNLQ